MREVFSVLSVTDVGSCLKEEAAAILLLLKNEGSRTTEGMIGNSSLLAAVLTVASVVSLSVLSLLCLRHKRKTKIIHEEQQIYNPQIFQRGGSVFAVMQSKTVTRPNQITSATIDTYDEEFSPTATDDQSDYENITDAQIETDVEQMYVAPLPSSLYVNEQTPERITNADQKSDVYANIYTSLTSNDNDDDYENSDFLEQDVQEQKQEQEPEQEQGEDDEPDYVNENGECA